MSRLTRAIILPTIGDPYRAGLWLSSYKKCMKDEVDQLYVCLNSDADIAVIEHVTEMYRAEGAEVFVFDAHCSHGFNIEHPLKNCKEDLVLFLEDDFYIVEPGHVDRWFRMIETGQVDAIGSPRGSCSKEVTDKVAETFGLTGCEVQCSSFWPSLYAGKVADFYRMRELNLGSHMHPAGKYIPELDWTPDKDECGDVFVWASIQLRALGLKFYIEDQGNWIDVWIRKEVMPWIHTGAGSSSFLSHLISSDGIPIGQRNNTEKTELAVIDGDSMLWITETKQAVWELIHENYPIPSDSPAAYFNGVYADALQNSREKVITTDGKKMTNSKIQEMRSWYEEILAPILD